MTCLRRITRLVIWGTVLGLSLAAGTLSASQPVQGERMVVPLNRSKLVVTQSPIAEVVVANPDIADVIVHGSTRISVLGRGIGTTDIRVFDAKNNVLKDMEVAVRYDLPAIRKILSTFFPYERIGVEMVNDNIALTGVVTDAEIAKKAVDIVSQFVDDSGASDTTAAAQQASSGSGGGGGEEQEEGPSIVNLLQVRTGAQVMLRVRIGEIQRSSLKKMGVNLSAIKSAGAFEFFTGSNGGKAPFNVDSDLTFGQFTFNPDSFGFGGGSYIGNNFGLTAVLEALERDGLFKVLAEPNLTATSGEKAEFLAGGEFPIPISQGNDSISVEFRPFGVAVEFTPFVLSGNRIRLVVKPEVSELSEAGAVNIEGFNIPGLNTRSARTTVEMAPGETFVIAGLLRDQINSTIEEIPGIAEVPILSALFRSTSFQRNETELVIAVTPYLVDPMVGTDVRFPTDNFRAPSTMEMFFYGALGSLSGEALTVSQTPSLEGPIGFMVD